MRLTPGATDGAYQQAGSSPNMRMRIVRYRRYALSSLAALLSAVGLPLDAQAGTLCEKSEEPIFSCVLKNKKIVSVCRRVEAAPRSVTYRFGAKKNIELEYSAKEGPDSSFEYGHYFRYQRDIFSLGFKLKGYEYSIYSNYDGESEPPFFLRGVHVTRTGAGGDGISIECASDIRDDDFIAQRNFSCEADIMVGCDPER